jgi:LETM1 and EF-hand domain-containing protein 1
VLPLQDPKSPSGALTKRIRSMLTKIDSQLQEYDNRVGSSLQMISADPQGRISVQDLEKALAVIRHKPDDEISHAVIQKLDPDQDGFVELEHVLGLVKEEGLGAYFLFGAMVFWLTSHLGRHSFGRESSIYHWTRKGD